MSDKRTCLLCDAIIDLDDVPDVKVIQRPGGGGGRVVVSVGDKVHILKGKPRRKAQGDKQ